jgi:tetratricopeptide (TPR) repeat protein
VGRADTSVLDATSPVSAFNQDLGALCYDFGLGLLLCYLAAGEGQMRRTLTCKIVAEIFCLLLLPSVSLAQSALPDETRESLSRLIEKYRGAGQLLEAEKSLRQELSLDEQTFGPGSSEVAEDLDTLSDVLSEDGKYTEAETALKDALAIYSVVEGPQRAANPFYMGRLASLGARQQRFAEAEQLYLEILELQRKQGGLENPATLSDLAELYHLAKDYPKSEAVYRRVVESKSLEPGSGVMLGSTERLGTVYEEQGKFEQAEALYRYAVDTDQLMLPRGHLATIANLNDLGIFYERRQRLQESETYYRLALEQFDRLSPDASLVDSNLAIVIRNYARLLRKEGRLNELEQYESRARTIEGKLAASRPAN